MLILWALAGLLAGSLVNLLIHQLLRIERESEPVESFRRAKPSPFYCQSFLLYVLARLSASFHKPDTVGRGALPRHVAAEQERQGTGPCPTVSAHDSGDSTLGGRSNCGDPGRTAVVVELSTAAAFGLLYQRFGADPRLLLASLYSCILVVVFVVDWQRHLIFDLVTFPSMALGVLLTPLFFGVPVVMSLLGLAVGGIIFAALYGIGYLVFRREALGQGDVKLAMVLGAMMGFPAIVVVVLVTSIIGGIAALALIVSGRSGREFMPYGTAMCLGAFVTFFLNVPSFH